MSKAGQRRSKKLVSYFRTLLATDPCRFEAEWQKRLVSWGEEVHARARRMRRQDCETPDGNEQLETSLYEIFDRAVELLDGCGPNAETLVGTQTRTFLDAECARAFASVACPEQRRLTNMYSNYLLMKRGTHRPQR